jgi:hypothetical protein
MSAGEHRRDEQPTADQQGEGHTADDRQDAIRRSAGLLPAAAF